MKKTNQNQPANPSRENSQLEAGYRVALKRIIRAATGVGHNDDTTEQLELAVKGILPIAPAIVARGVETWFEQAAKAWERDNKAQTLEMQDANCDRLRDRAERVLRLWHVKIDYPGLYPSFEIPGKGHFYDCESLCRELARSK